MLKSHISTHFFFSSTHWNEFLMFSRHFRQVFMNDYSQKSENARFTMPKNGRFGELCKYRITPVRGTTGNVTSIPFSNRGDNVL